MELTFSFRAGEEEQTITINIQTSVKWWEMSRGKLCKENESGVGGGEEHF